MGRTEELEIHEALDSASRLYGRYLDIAKLAEIPVSVEYYGQYPASVEVPFYQSMDFTINTGALHANVEQAT